jgi:hypothetical protein
MSDQHPGNGSHCKDQRQEHHELQDSDGFMLIVDGSESGAEPTASCGLNIKRGAFHGFDRSITCATVPALLLSGLGVDDDRYRTIIG